MRTRQEQSNPEVLNSYKLNEQLILKNRVLMAPMTRTKANNDGTVTQAMADYYSRRAGVGLIITEGTWINPEAKGFSNVGALYEPKHVQAWRQVTEAVHRNHGLIFSQIWHVGRVTHPIFIDGKLPLAPSVTLMTGSVPRHRHIYFGKSRAATTAEIRQTIADYANAARNAIQAGFDGVEIHGANGYLVDQFLHHHTNQRTDEYGGTPENMARFALEVVRACGEAIGYQRLGLRLSPAAYINEMVGDKRDYEVFKYLLQELNHLPIAYVHTGNFDDRQTYAELKGMSMTAFMRLYYRGTLIAAGNYTHERAKEGIARGDFDLVAIGRPLIANPDLLERWRNSAFVHPYQVEMLETYY